MEKTKMIKSLVLTLAVVGSFAGAAYGLDKTTTVSTGTFDKGGVAAGKEEATEIDTKANDGSGETPETSENINNSK